MAKEKWLLAWEQKDLWFVVPWDRKAYRTLLKLVFFLSAAVLLLPNLYSQKNPVLYAGFEFYRHTGFEDNSFGNFNIGSQVYQWKFLAPEVGFDYYWGSLNERDVYFGSERQYTAPAKFQQGFSAALLTLSPKLRFGKDDAFISFSPKFHTGSVSGRGDYFVLNDGIYKHEERQRSRVPVSFWSFSIAIEGLAVQTEKYWFSLSLHYTEVDARNAFSKLNFSEESVFVEKIHATTIGIGLRFYFNPFPVKGN